MSAALATARRGGGAARWLFFFRVRDALESKCGSVQSSSQLTVSNLRESPDPGESPDCVESHHGLCVVV